MQATEHLERFKRGDRDGGFFALLEMSHGILPELFSAFQAEADSCTRAFIVEVVWQHRQDSAIPFLAEALCDPEKSVWLQAIDGLVALGSQPVLDVLNSARDREFACPRAGEEYLAWLEEAIQQVLAKS